MTAMYSRYRRRIFWAGLKHSLADAKWPAFEKSSPKLYFDKIGDRYITDLKKGRIY